MLEEVSIFRLTKRTHHGVHKLMKTMMDEYNIGWRQMRILSTIAEEGKINQCELYKRVNIDRAVITNSLKSLIANGYLEKSRCMSDKRRFIILPTEKGNALVPKLKDAFNRCEKILTSNLSEDEIQQLRCLLGKVADSVDKELNIGSK